MDSLNSAVGHQLKGQDGVEHGSCSLSSTDEDKLTLWEMFDPEEHTLVITVPNYACMGVKVVTTNERYFALEASISQFQFKVAYLLRQTFLQSVKLDVDQKDRTMVCVRPSGLGNDSNSVLFIPGFLLPESMREDMLKELIQVMDQNKVVTVLPDHDQFVQLAPSTLVVHGLDGYKLYTKLDRQKPDTETLVAGSDEELYRTIDPTVGIRMKPSKKSAAQIRSKVRSLLASESATGATETTLQTVYTLCSFINPEKRCLDYKGMCEIGETIFAAIGCVHIPEGLEMWKELCEKSPIAQLHDLGELWSKFKCSGIDGIRTLRMYAGADNSEAYKAWKDSNTEELLNQTLNTTGGRSDIAKLLYNLYGDGYVCSDYRNNAWYCFQKRWKPMDGTLDINRAVFSTIPRYMSILSEISAQQSTLQAEDESELGKCESKLKLCTNMIKNIKDTKFRDAITKECAIFFYDPEFELCRDKDTTLLGFDDKVYDTKILGFRDALPKDRVTMSCGYSAPTDEEFNINHPDVVAVLNIIEKIITNPDIRRFFWKLKAYAAFEPGNLRKMFVCIIGPSNGGKSVFEVFSEAALGDYWAKPSLEQLTFQGSSSPDAPTPSKEILRYAREVQYSEPEKGATINTSFIKTVSSGGDSIYSRNLHQIINRSTPAKFVPGFVPILTSNHLPIYDGTDTSMTNRIVAINCDSTFIDPDAVTTNQPGIPDTPEEQMKAKIFYMDDTVKTKAKTTLFRPYMWLLTHYYRIYRIEGLAKPDGVKAFTRQMSCNNDVVQAFVEAKVDRSPSRNVFVTAEALYREFKTFYLQNYVTGSQNRAGVMDQMTFNDKFKNKGYERDTMRGHWLGLELRKPT
jgi:phage/plasmid-associated DNA primase